MKLRRGWGGGSGAGRTSGGGAAGLILRQGICGSPSAGSLSSSRDGLAESRSDMGRVCSWSRILFGAYGS
jgi:hypothetical protein